MPDSAARDHIALALIPGLGPKLTRAALAEFGSPGAVLAASADELTRVPGIGAGLAAKFAKARAGINVERELELLARHRVRALVRGGAGYPARLAELPDAPGLLYVRGAVTTTDEFAVGIVGSRGCTSYGRRAAETLAAELAGHGYTIVSGLARGIDAAAHTGALRAKGRTIGVLAGGLASIYPPEHQYLADEVADHGALVTETPMAMDPLPGMFHARNRIISALSLAVVVIEANAKSGALITASHAAEQGREVFALPDRADNPASAGCLELIRKGARLVRDAADVLEDLRGLRGDSYQPRPLRVEPPEVPRPPRALPAAPERPAPAAKPAPQLSGVDQEVYDALGEPAHLDDLARKLGRPVHELMGVLMVLEMSRLVRKLPGNSYERG